MATDNQLEQMKQKYALVLTAIEQQQVRLTHVHIQDNKLFIQGTAPSEQAKNKVWDEIKRINPDWSRELTADIQVEATTNGSSTQAAPSQEVPKRTYTVKPGDSLSKISKELYGDPNRYTKIFDANRDVLSDPNQISPGQTLKIPS